MISSAGYTASIARAHGRHIDLAAQRLTDPQAQFRLEARPDQFVAAEHVPGRPAVQDAAEHRLVEAELLLDRRRGQPHLPADLPLARGDAARDDAELDAIRLIERQAIEPLRRENTRRARAPFQKLLDRGLFVERHRCPPGRDRRRLGPTRDGCQGRAAVQAGLPQRTATTGRPSHADRHHWPAGFRQGNAGGVPQPRRHGRGGVLRAGEGPPRSAARRGRGTRRAGAPVPQADRSRGAGGDARRRTPRSA